MKSLGQQTVCICVDLTTLSVYHTGVYIVYLPLVQTNRVVSNHVYKALYYHSPKSGLWSSSGYPITIIKPLCSIQIAQPNEPFLLQADVPNICLSAVLSQVRGDQEHPVAYASRQLLPWESHYPIVEKERLAIVWSSKYFHGYLCGQKSSSRLITNLCYSCIAWPMPTLVWLDGPSLSNLTASQLFIWQRRGECDEITQTMSNVSVSEQKLHCLYIYTAKTEWLKLTFVFVKINDLQVVFMGFYSNQWDLTTKTPKPILCCTSCEFKP